MRKRERDIIVRRIDEDPDTKPGGPICIRPFSSDDKKLDEIVEETGEVKSALVRRMIRFALSDKRANFASDRCQGKLDWLIKHGRKTEDVSSQAGSRIGDILERVETLENEVKILAANSHQIPTFLRELYCMTSILVSSQNLIFTRLLEFASPSQKEREQAVLIAAAARANQIGEAVKDLRQFSAFHAIDFGDVHLLTKVKAIKDLIATSSSQPKQQTPAE
jgi:signal transduction histidine kinase